MKKCLKILTILVILGGLSLTMTACAKGPFKTFEEKVSTVTEAFTGIEISADTADITLLPSSDGSCRVVSFDHKRISYITSVTGGVLKIEKKDERGFLSRIFNFGKQTLAVYLPSAEYESLKINSSTGDISVTDQFSFGDTEINISTGDIELKNLIMKSLSITLSTGDVDISSLSCAENLSITVSTGDLKLDSISCADLTSSGTTGGVRVNALTANNVSIERSTSEVAIGSANLSGDVQVKVTTGDTVIDSVKCRDLITKGSTGELDLRSVISDGKFDIERSTGDVTFDKCDASEISVTTDTGDVKGSFLTDKIILATADTGKIRVPESTTGGKCIITTDTGDITISIEK